MKKQIIESFWKSVPDNATMEDMADGIDVTFTFEGKSYTVNTRIEQARTKSFETCYNTWDNKAVAIVHR